MDGNHSNAKGNEDDGLCVDYARMAAVSVLYWTVSNSMVPDCGGD